MEKNIESTEADRASARREKVKTLNRERLERERLQKEAAHAEREQKERNAWKAQQKADEAERQQFHADEWGMLNALQRSFALLAVATEKDSPSLASAIRSTLSASLSGTDGAFPRAQWHEGLQLDTLPEDRREDLTLAARKETENIALSAIPSHELLRLKLVCANDPQSMLTMWRVWRQDTRTRATR